MSSLYLEFVECMWFICLCLIYRLSAYVWVGLCSGLMCLGFSGLLSSGLRVGKGVNFVSIDK